jgi:hypothetical protein
VRFDVSRPSPQFPASFPHAPAALLGHARYIG